MKGRYLKLVSSVEVDSLMVPALPVICEADAMDNLQNFYSVARVRRRTCTCTLFSTLRCLPSSPPHLRSPCAALRQTSTACDSARVRRFCSGFLPYAEFTYGGRPRAKERVSLTTFASVVAARKVDVFVAKHL